MNWLLISLLSLGMWTDHRYVDFWISDAGGDDKYVVECSTNLETWQAVGTVIGRMPYRVNYPLTLPSCATYYRVRFSE